MLNLISVYHCLPYPLKTIIANARGYQLRWWRYGKEIEKLIDKAQEREQLAVEHTAFYIPSGRLLGDSCAIHFYYCNLRCSLHGKVTFEA